VIIKAFHVFFDLIWSNDERVRDLQNPSGSHGLCKVVLYLDFDFCADKVLVLLRLRFKLLKAFAALRDLLELESGF